MTDGTNQLYKGSAGEPEMVRLARIETKLDHFLAHQADHETRIRHSEGQLKALWGGGSLLSAIVAFVVGLVTLSSWGGTGNG